MRNYILATFLIIIPLVFYFFLVPEQSEARVTMNLTPEKVMQGEPLQIVIKGTKKSDIVTTTFAGINIPMTYYKKSFIGFVPIDIRKPVGFYEIQSSISGKSLKRTIEVVPRPKAEAPLGIPQKLGGNTEKAQKELVDTLASENASLLNLGTADRALWRKAFIYPVDNPIVTDPYGYSRLTGAYTITHKGTDFRAPVGTPVYAVSDGVVKLARYGRNYGNTIVIDHGNGIQSFYMHLSEMKVKPGDTIHRDDLIALSGQTGYAESPHLHFTLRINDVSVDPVVFLGFWE